MHAVLRHLLGDTPPAPVAPDIESWWERYESIRARFRDPIETALAAGFAADRLAFAFAAGYEAALTRLVPSLAGVPAALCVTESGGNRPRHIETTVTREGDASRLSGEKTFVTLGTAAERLLVVANEGDAAGHPKLAVYAVPSSRVGVSVETRAPTSFLPEIPHAHVRLASVRVTDDERVGDDGYLRIVKPFRTIEDIHVFAAITGLFIRYGRAHGWPHGVLERLVEVATSLARVAEMPPLDPVTHVALAGVLETMGRFLDSELPCLSDLLPEATRERLYRDSALFAIASRARNERRMTAWAALSTGL